jgi:hypothetical protein
MQPRVTRRRDVCVPTPTHQKRHDLIYEQYEANRYHLKISRNAGNNAAPMCRAPTPTPPCEAIPQGLSIAIKSLFENKINFLIDSISNRLINFCF